MQRKSQLIVYGIALPVVAALLFSGIDSRNSGNLLGLLESSSQSSNLDGFKKNEKDNLDRLGLTRPASSVRAVSPVLTARDSIMYYDRDSGRVYDLSLVSGQERRVTENSLPDFLYSIWGRGQQDVISIFSTTKGMEKRYFNFATREVGQIDSDAESIVFSPDGIKIAYFVKGGEGGIYTSSASGLRPEQLLRTRLNTAQLFWNESGLYLLGEDSDTGYDVLYKIGDEGDIRLVAKKEKLDSVAWGPGGQQMMYRSGDSVKVFNVTTGAEVTLSRGFDPTACSWDKPEEIICIISSGSRQTLERISLNDTSVVMGDIPSSLKAEKVISSLDGNVTAIHDSYSGKLFLVKTPPLGKLVR